MPQAIKHSPHSVVLLNNITFKNERGVPVVCKDGILTISARGDRDTTSIYAYDYDGQVVGKVNVMSYDKVTRKVCLVPVGIDKSEIKASEIKQGLDEKFAKLMVDFEVTVAERIDITYANGDKFVHGGSGVIGVYNDDQKSAISKLKETIAIDDETCYMFMVENCIAKKADDSNDIVSGYMPRGYQFGFIYKELNNSRTIAHELSHGAFHLKHTFVADDDYIAPERSTDNLMDYAGGETLNHWQWQDVHLPKSVRFKWLQDEAGAEAKSASDPVITKLEWRSLPSDIEGLFLKPDGKLMWLSLKANSQVRVMKVNDAGGIADFENRAIYGFVDSESNDMILSEFEGEKFIKYYHKEIGLDYEDKLSQEKIKFNAFNFVNLWQDDEYGGSFVVKPWLVVDDNNVILLYDWLENRLRVITDVKDGLSWIRLSGRETDLNDIMGNDPHFEVLTESDLFGYHIRDYMNDNSPWGMLIQNTKQFVFDLVDRAGSQLINELNPRLIDDETKYCLQSLWEGEEGRYLKNRLSIALEPIIRGEKSDRSRIIAHEISTFMKDSKADKFVECFISFLNQYMESSEATTCMNDFWTDNSEIIRSKLSDYNFIKSMLETEGMSAKLEVAEDRFSSFFHEDAVINKMSDCIVDYAIALCPEVETLDEEGKQNVFKTNAEKTVGILLYEFATGEGPAERQFTDIDNECPFVTEYLKGRIRSEISSDLKTKLTGKGCQTYDDFKILFSDKGVEIPLELTPGEKLPIWQSVIRHFLSNLEQIFIGGAVATIRPTDDSSIINVEIENTTGMRSLFLHITKDVNIQGDKLSNKKQVLKTNIKIELNDLFNK